MSEQHRKLLGLLVNVFRPREWNEQSMEGYLYALRDTPLEELSEAVQYALKTFTRMPYPAELIGRTMALNAQTKEVEKITERLRQKGIIDENGAYIEEAQQGELE